MRQSGDDMVLWLLSAPNHCWKNRSDLFQVGAGIQRMKAGQTGTKTVRQGQSLIERLTHNFASFDS